MELLIQREQKSGMLGMGGIKFLLTVKARLTPEEEALVKKYKMDDIIIFEKIPLAQAAEQFGGMTSLVVGIASKALDLRFLVKDLLGGKTVEVKDVAEAIAAEEQIKSAAKNFHTLLMAAANFKGEEVISFK